MCIVVINNILITGHVNMLIMYLYIDSQGRGAFKDKVELKTSSKYTLRHTESRVKVSKRLRGGNKEDESKTLLLPVH